MATVAYSLGHESVGRGGTTRSLLATPVVDGVISAAIANMDSELVFLFESNEVPADIIAKFGVFGYTDMEGRGFSEAEANSQVEKLSSASLLAPPSPTDCADDSSDEDIDGAQSGLETPEPLPVSSSHLVIAGSSEIDIPMG